MGNIVGSTFIVYEPINEVSIGALEDVVPFQRVISHDQSTYFIGGVFYPHEYLDIAKSLLTKYRFSRLYVSMNHLALPLVGSWQNAYRASPGDAVFQQWAQEYIKYMLVPGKDVRICFGNEPEVEGCPYQNNETLFRSMYAALCRAVRRLEDLGHPRITLGAGGWVMDWKRAGEFVDWAINGGFRLDFVDVHIYENPDRLHDARAQIDKRIPIAVLESGADWRTGTQISMATQRAFYKGMQSGTDRCNVEAWHLMHGVAGTSVQPLALMGPRRGLTPIGKMVVSGRGQYVS